MDGGDARMDPADAGGSADFSPFRGDGVSSARTRVGYVLWEEARRVLTAAAEGALDDDELVAMVARSVLGAPRDEGRSNYQIAIHVCEDCGRARRRAGGAHVTIDQVMYETACWRSTSDTSARRRPSERSKRCRRRCTGW
jgi:hypothetical protein